MVTDGLVSIIVPVYNAEKYIANCIDSLLVQTHSNIEIILVDDGSLDNSVSVCEKYAKLDKRIQIVRQKNKGVSSARNKGLDYCQGQYITFVDSDDELYPEAIETLFDNIIVNEADVSIALRERISTNGKSSDEGADKNINIWIGLEALINSLRGNRHTNSCHAKLFKKDIIENVRFVEGRQMNEDGFFVFECFVNKPKVVVQNVLVYKYFIRKGSSTTGEFSEKFFDPLYFCEKKKEIISECFPELWCEINNMEVRTRLYFLQALCRTNDKKYKEAEKKSISFVKQHYSEFYSLNKHERKIAWIVAHGLYSIYKLVFRLKYGNQIT